MGYVLLQTYGFFHANPRQPSWWTGRAMVYKGLWVTLSMGDCSGYFRLLTNALKIQQEQIRSSPVQLSE